MRLPDIINRQSPPIPWNEGDNIPWNNPEFSKRMLREHLDQNHDAASRRFEIIDKHVDWIHHEILFEKSSNILDLGCGPGFYLLRLAKLGHRCAGIDYSPSSITYAREQAEKKELSIKCIDGDIRRTDFGTGFDLVMLIFGELNVFCSDDARVILKKAYHALKRDGTLIVEPHAFAALENWGTQSPTWYSAEKGLFSDRPHLCLRENFWDPDSRRATTRYFIVDAATCNAERYAASYQAYTEDEYKLLLEECGFTHIRQYNSLTGKSEESQKDFIAIAARK
jgi:SAM-dependent methyltransferase